MRLNQTLSTEQVLQNGDFETGSIAGWTFLGRPADGYATISTTNVYSGTNSLVLVLYPPPPGSNFYARIVIAVEQTVAVTNLRGLVVSAWYSPVISSLSAGARLRVTIQGLTINYYVAYGPQISSQLAQTDTQKEVLLSGGCVGWCPVSLDVGNDFSTMFDQAKYSSAFGANGPVMLKVALENVGYGFVSGNQFVYWDNVQALASVPAAFTTTTEAATTQPRSTETQIVTQTPTLTAQSREVVTTATLQPPTQPGIALVSSEVIVSGLVAIGLVFLVGVLIFWKKAKPV